MVHRMTVRAVGTAKAVNVTAPYSPAPAPAPGRCDGCLAGRSGAGSAPWGRRGGKAVPWGAPGVCVARGRYSDAHGAGGEPADRSMLLRRLPRSRSERCGWW
jgi:hypothetical protein